jgi:transcriptional regulator with XRE-family HTH domain
MFAQRLRDLRKSRQALTQAKLAEILDVSQQAVGLWERGKNMPTHELVSKIASFFDVTTDYLLGLSDDPHGSTFAGQDGKHFLLFAGQQEPEQEEPRYYHDPEVAEMANQLKDNPDMRVLFDASRDLKKESIEEVVKFIQYQKAKERGEF